MKHAHILCELIHTLQGFSPSPAFQRKEIFWKQNCGYGDNFLLIPKVVKKL
jgi:hypothetical protein